MSSVEFLQANPNIPSYYKPSPPQLLLPHFRPLDALILCQKPVWTWPSACYKLHNTHTQHVSALHYATCIGNKKRGLVGSNHQRGKAAVNFGRNSQHNPRRLVFKSSESPRNKFMQHNLLRGRAAWRPTWPFWKVPMALAALSVSFTWKTETLPPRFSLPLDSP